MHAAAPNTRATPRAPRKSLSLGCLGFDAALGALNTASFEPAHKAAAPGRQPASPVSPPHHHTPTCPSAPSSRRTRRSSMERRELIQRFLCDRKNEGRLSPGAATAGRAFLGMCHDAGTEATPRRLFGPTPCGHPAPPATAGAKDVFLGAWRSHLEATDTDADTVSTGTGSDSDTDTYDLSDTDNDVDDNHGAPAKERAGASGNEPADAAAVCGSPPCTRPQRVLLQQMRADRMHAEEKRLHDRANRINSGSNTGNIDVGHVETGFGFAAAHAAAAQESAASQDHRNPGPCSGHAVATLCTDCGWMQGGGRADDAGDWYCTGCWDSYAATAASPTATASDEGGAGAGGDGDGDGEFAWNARLAAPFMGQSHAKDTWRTSQGAGAKGVTLRRRQRLRLRLRPDPNKPRSTSPGGGGNAVAGAAVGSTPQQDGAPPNWLDPGSCPVEAAHRRTSEAAGLAVHRQQSDLLRLACPVAWLALIARSRVLQAVAVLLAAVFVLQAWCQ